MDKNTSEIKSTGDLKERWRRESCDAEKVWACLPKEIVFEEDSAIRSCFHAIYQKQANLFFSAYRLCELGFGNEARVIERTLYELWLIADNLTNDKEPERFAADLLAWGHANEHKRLLGVLERHPEAKDDAVAGRFLKILEEKLVEAKGRWGDKWGEFIKRGPVSAGPGALSWKKGAPLGEYYNSVSSVAHSYDLHFYYPYENRKEIDHFLDVRGEVIDNCIVWLTNTLELGRKHFPLVGDDEYKSIVEIRDRILKQQ